ncbi:MAG: diacylglycerol kinase [Pseudomonadota bacterium]
MLAYLKREAARVWSRCWNTLEGIGFAWREESSFSQWVFANIASAALTFAVEMTAVERALIIGFGLLVLVVELLNTGIEAAIDRISADQHPLSKKAKDTACAAVALTAITTGVVWIIVLIG